MKPYHLALNGFAALLCGAGATTETGTFQTALWVLCAVNAVFFILALAALALGADR